VPQHAARVEAQLRIEHKQPIYEVLRGLRGVLPNRVVVIEPALADVVLQLLLRSSALGIKWVVTCG
jgi:hypothetical protein